ncbi:MAG: SMP-30/gluconolactonase/LRE family protein [Deltaproteobacteria bacterium]|nr:SMP-30/gluconolactonase/LRE family protein [Deltaproteobacteria bacterium]
MVQGLAAPNGIGIAPEGNVLWVGEMLRNGLVRIEVMEDGVTLPPITPISYPYYFSGHPGPDGMTIDGKGHVYQAMNFQGRVVILRAGIPVAQVLIPGRDEGKYLRVTNLAFKPGTADAYITLSGNGGAWVYKFRGLAEGLKLFSHQ